MSYNLSYLSFTAVYLYKDNEIRKSCVCGRKYTVTNGKLLFPKICDKMCSQNRKYFWGQFAFAFKEIVIHEASRLRHVLISIVADRLTWIGNPTSITQIDDESSWVRAIREVTSSWSPVGYPRLLFSSSSRIYPRRKRIGGMRVAQQVAAFIQPRAPRTMPLIAQA